MTRGAADPPERFVRLAAALRRQRLQIAQVVAEAQEALAGFAEREPALLELRGIGAIVHDFYTGIVVLDRPLTAVTLYRSGAPSWLQPEPRVLLDG